MKLRIIISLCVAFSRSIHDNIFIVGKVFKNEMAITEFNEFCNKIEDIFEDTREIDCGLVNSFIRVFLISLPLSFLLS